MQTVQYIPQKMKLFRIAFANKLDAFMSLLIKKVKFGTTVFFTKMCKRYNTSLKKWSFSGLLFANKLDLVSFWAEDTTLFNKKTEGGASPHHTPAEGLGGGSPTWIQHETRYQIQLLQNKAILKNVIFWWTYCTVCKFQGKNTLVPGFSCWAKKAKEKLT